MLFDICDLTFVICYLIFAIWYLLFDICYLICDICYLIFVVWYLLFDICYLMFVIWYFFLCYICYLLFDICYLLCIIWYLLLQLPPEDAACRSGASWCTSGLCCRGNPRVPWATRGTRRRSTPCCPCDQWQPQCESRSRAHHHYLVRRALQDQRWASTTCLSRASWPLNAAPQVGAPKLGPQPRMSSLLWAGYWANVATDKIRILFIN